MASTPRVVVGVDGSEASRAAVRWAAGEAVVRHAPVLLVHAWSVDPGTRAARMLLADEQREAEAPVLLEAAELLRSVAPGLDPECDLPEGRTGAALVAASQHAALLVVGHGSSGAGSAMLRRVAVRSGCPVVAVPSGTTADAGVAGPVVVGVDDSPASEEAVAFAFQHADLHRAPLVAVLAVRPPFDAYLPGEPELERIRETGRRQLSESLAGCRERFPDVSVTERVSLDAPLIALQAAGVGARLLVVGSHGRGALLRAALGSVSGGLLRAAACPLVVVRHRRVDVAPSYEDAGRLAPLTS